MNEPVRMIVCRRGAASRMRVEDDGANMRPDVRPNFPVGQCVVHKVFGVGKISASHGKGDARVVDIEFIRHGLKSFQLVFAAKNMRPEDAPAASW